MARTTAQKIANPAWRKHVKDADLKKARPDLYQKRLAARRVKEENATLYNPSALLSGDALRQSVKGLVDADVNPGIREYDREIANTGAQTEARTAVSNAQYDAQQKNISDAAYAAQQNTARAAGLQAQLQNNTVSTLSTQGANQQSYVNKLAANMGMDIGGGAQVAQQTAQQVQDATAQGQQRQVEATQIGSGFEALMQAMAGATTLKKGEAATRIGLKGQSDMSDLMGKRSDLEAKRGPLTSKYLTDLRQQMFTNQATAETLDLKGQQFQADVADDAADNATAATNAATSRARAGETARHNRVTEGVQDRNAATAEARERRQAREDAEDRAANGGKSTFKPATGTQVNSANSQIQYALGVAKTLKGKVARHVAATTLVQGQAANSKEGVPGVNKSPQLMASVALDVAYDGHVSRENARRLKRMGITLKDLGLPSYTSTRAKATPNRPTSFGNRPHG